MKNQKGSIFVLLSIISLMNINKVKADDWDNFYQKYNGRFFILSWEQQDYKKDGSVGAPLKREFGYSLVSSYNARRIWRNENKVTGQVNTPGDIIIPKDGSSPLTNGGRQTIEIKGNKLINTWINRVGEITGETIITVNGNSCSGKINDYEYSGNNAASLKRKNMTCKIVSAF